MKIFLFAAIVSFFTVTVNAQHNHGSHEHGTTSTSQQTSLSQVLPLYYDVKNALVAGDAATASAKADAFAKAVNGADMSTLQGKEMDAFMAAQKKLAADGAQLAATNDIQKQRDAFATLSADVATLAKGVKLSSQPVYIATCPMKKATWLSSEAAIKNPYYGKQMLTCGKVTETIK